MEDRIISAVSIKELLDLKQEVLSMGIATGRISLTPINNLLIF